MKNAERSKGFGPWSTQWNVLYDSISRATRGLPDRSILMNGQEKII